MDNVGLEVLSYGNCVIERNGEEEKDEEEGIVLSSHVGFVRVILHGGTGWIATTIYICRCIGNNLEHEMRIKGHLW